MDSFGERLRALRQEKEIGQVQLAKEINVGKSIISLWEQNKCEPTLSNLVALARFFNVSIDYLAGLED
ncbi:MAG: helix-turn-helix transcriptional regulator [Clostridia bacterium]|nr:helix-turn-helix transcriptional regulator [Clostridia bacterium]